MADHIEGVSPTDRLIRMNIAAGAAMADFYAGEGDPERVTAVRALYEHDPSDPIAAVRRRAIAIDAEFRQDRVALCAALTEYNRRIGAGPSVFATIERLRDPRAVAVVTGQQAGLLSGPLYTLSKAAGAVSVARQVEGALGRPVVPVFWAATEDHDLPEADHAWFIDRDEAWRRIRYAPSGGSRPGLSVGSITVEKPQIEQVLRQLEAVLPCGPLADEALAAARTTGLQASSLGDWFCRLMAVLCGELGLPLIDPMQPEFRRLASQGVAAVLKESDAIAQALYEGHARVRDTGLTPQLELNRADAHLFYYPEGPAGPRVALERMLEGPGKGGFRLRNSPESLGEAIDLAERALDEPERFSGSVVTRPILQDFILPTVAYIAGPGEIGYYGILRRCYAAVRRTMPVIWPRPGFTVIDPTSARLLRRRGIDTPALPESLENARAAAIAAADTVGIDALFCDLRRSVEDAYQPVVPALAGFDAVLGRLAAHNRDRVQRELGWLERKSWQVARQRSAEALGQLDRLATRLWPRRGPQERTLCGLAVIAAHGSEIPARLAKANPGPPYGHYLFYLE